MPLTAASSLVRTATHEDVPAIIALIRELAVYSKLEHRLEVTERAIADALFGPHPAAEALVATLTGGDGRTREPSGGQVIGYAMFFPTFSSFVGRRGLWVEDIYVAEAHRGCGAGKAMLAELARIAIERGWAHMEWCALDWNTSARRFYESLGAAPKPEYVVHQLAGDSLKRLSTSPLT